MKVKWNAGSPHPTAPNVVAAAEEGQWSPAPGYVWINKAELRVRLDPVLEDMYCHFRDKAAGKPLLVELCERKAILP